MSELKWNWVYCPYLDAPDKQKESALKAGYIKVVRKSEADKVIARLESDIAIKDNLNKLCLNALRHQKRKRCLARAESNWWQANGYSAAEITERIRGHILNAIICSELENKYLKRYHKWLELADKFKEEK